MRSIVSASFHNVSWKLNFYELCAQTGKDNRMGGSVIGEIIESYFDGV